MDKTAGRKLRRVNGHRMIRIPLGPARPRQRVRGGWNLECACGWAAETTFATRAVAEQAYSAHLDDVKPVVMPKPTRPTDDPRVVPIPGEQWLPAPGWEGFYQVSDCGRVWSLPRPRTAGGLVAPTRVGGTLQHLGVRLTIPGKRAMVAVHKLVGLAFLGPRPPGMLICHGPGGSLDNRALNLYYGTPVSNMHDRVRDGTDIRGEDIPWAKLTEAIVQECRRRSAAGERQAALAREFGVTPSTLSNAIKGKTWAHVPMPGKAA